MSAPRKSLPPLRPEDMSDDPIEQFAEWWELAQAEVPLPDAMTLATVDGGSEPDARIVLLKCFGPDGFRFFTNYESDKGAQLAARPVAALVLYWRELDRQVRIRGTVSRLSAEDSDAYFATRPRESRIGAIASPQSRPIEREDLDRRYEEADAANPGEDITRPEHWGGFLLAPRTIEFWQGRSGRLHDRVAYVLDGERWVASRLSP
jgi:pyridoxamine 5'-phosphate oxidase